MKIKIFLGAVLLSSLAFQSCKKHKQGVTTYQTVDVTIDANNSYQYNFGTEKTDLSITKQSQSFLVSELDKVNEATLFNYSPKLNFSGVDEVEVTSFEEPEKEGGKGGHHGNCENHNGKKEHDEDDNKIVYTFKISVKNSTTAPTKIINEN